MEGTRLPGIKEAPDEAWAEHVVGIELPPEEGELAVTSAGLVEETAVMGSSSNSSGRHFTCLPCMRLACSTSKRSW